VGLGGCGALCLSSSGKMNNSEITLLEVLHCFAAATHQEAPIGTPSLPDSFEVSSRLAESPPDSLATQGPIHPQPHPVPLHLVHPRSHDRRAVAWWRGGSPTCSGTGRQGGAVRSLRVPGLTVPLDAWVLQMCRGERCCGVAAASQKSRPPPRCLVDAPTND